MGIELEGCSFKSALAWADERWDAIEKCPVCGDPLPDKRKRYRLTDDPDRTEFCSESCADKEHDFQESERAAWDADDLDMSTL